MSVLADMRAELAAIDAVLDAEPPYDTTAAYERRGHTSRLDRLARRRAILRWALQAYSTDDQLAAEDGTRAARGI